MFVGTSLLVADGQEYAYLGASALQSDMTPPEVILDRWVKAQARSHHGFAGYVGKLDIEKVASPSFRSFLYFVQEAMNGALRSENANASGGAEHPPFHFDYLQVSDGTRNAHAFQHEGFSFIVVTLPLVELLWDLSQRLSESPFVLQLLRIDPVTARAGALHGLLFVVQLSFLVSHEYTHHVHRHIDQAPEGTAGLWSEFLRNETNGGIDFQAQEIDADGYALYLGLANLVRGAGRHSALEQLGLQDMPSIDADELLLMSFFLALTALFCALWSENIKMKSIDQLRHPPAPVRIEYAIRIAQMWSDQNGSVPHSWFSAERFQSLFRAAVAAIGGTAQQAWDADISFLRSEEGAKYDRRLSERFEAIRKMETAAKAVQVAGV